MIGAFVLLGVFAVLGGLPALLGWRHNRRYDARRGA